MSTPSREQFVAEVLECVGDRFPLVKIARGDQPFSMKVNGHVASLENLYRSVLLHPDESRHQIERWIVELLRASEGSPDRNGTFDELKDRILPMILADKDVENHKNTVTQPLIEGLHVAYAIDSDRTIAYIPEAQFDAWHITRDELHEAASENLITRSEAMSAHAAQDEEGR